MIKEEMKEVNAVKVVLEVFKEYLDKKEDIPYEVVKYVVKELSSIEKDYDKTINDLLVNHSLVVKMEQLVELIGAVGTISIEDEENLDKTLVVLNDYVSSYKS